MSERILVTGAAGFIGFHITKRLLENGFSVVGIDNLNDYYAVELKTSRLSILKTDKQFVFMKQDISVKKYLEQLFKKESFDYVIHLAAQAGVRYSIDNPDSYIQSNIIGFYNILELCRKYPVKHLVYASSSSVYGGHKVIPFKESHQVDQPVSLYAATKKSNELMAYTYSHLYKVPTTGLRFFTVYGPYGRPDMAYFKFTDRIMNHETIDVYNYGKMERDFTYIDDIVEGIIRVLKKPSVSLDPYNVFNIGRGQPIKLMDFISLLEKHLEEKAIMNFTEMQPGDVITTYADVSDLKAYIGYNPQTTFEEGIKSFISWYRSFYK
ncbi:MAG: GDP-mannose 4,6-dehydratase [Clostridiales bacterium]|nr:GDP-mannose 4,6-dehydratase [Clostridiales bacterium]